MWNSSFGNYYLPSKVFTLMNNEPDKTHLNCTAYIKVQNTPSGLTPSPSTTGQKSKLPVIIGSIVGAFLTLVFIGVKCWKRGRSIEEEVYLNQVWECPLGLHSMN